ncbi:MAG: hypothetical protein JRF63_06895 [Deltaproteobacteria bacterium]|nr:hypothetical protein [Deltaproteobacteria bacterium]
MGLVTPQLVRAILESYLLPLDGRHGPGHWARVFENGQRIARLSGADVELVELFALFHDSKRVNESNSPDHGLRGAELAASLRGRLFELDDGRFSLLHEACALHTDGLTDADISVQTCWDADRLDLGRVGFTPDRTRLCTEAARDPTVMRWAYERSRNFGASLPTWVCDRWGISR